MLCVSPSTQVPPGIVPVVNIGKGDKEALVTAVFHSIHLNGAVIGADIKGAVVAL